MRKFNSLAATFAASVVGLSIIGTVSQAQAASIVPSTEGEVKLTNLTCFTATCVAPSGYTVKSHTLSGVYGKSYLFVDKTGANTYNGVGAGNLGFSINFDANDIGTNNSNNDTWFRPVARETNGTFPEDGQFEYGIFTFTFDNILDTLKLSFLDTEKPGTSVLEVNGVAYANGNIAAGPNDNIQLLSLTNVKSFKVKLGSSTGTSKDGVLLQASVPEPTNVLGLSALGVAGVFALRKGKKASIVA
ncbi:PEP-CTERM sorting domain-containing protein [Anabaena sp. UHCC 0187]|uniref:LEVG family PEP-CTERM protein n=1 Tax=Anabaena sp. UHCC 0187 TaxID=2590018 RepID=UPI0014476B2A|nr:LEVG family PEP-CTERM protein [Anabaena sp. UHCC 0187]MTJ14185.1 PEP-CTERM sorting domain-containing protein [Anabaena sp. UHCC 0187]